MTYNHFLLLLSLLMLLLPLPVVAGGLLATSV